MALTRPAEQWNSVHPAEQPIIVIFFEQKSQWSESVGFTRTEKFPPGNRKLKLLLGNNFD